MLPVKIGTTLLLIQGGVPDFMEGEVVFYNNILFLPIQTNSQCTTTQQILKPEENNVEIILFLQKQSFGNIYMERK